MDKDFLLPNGLTVEQTISATLYDLRGHYADIDNTIGIGSDWARVVETQMKLFEIMQDSLNDDVNEVAKLESIVDDYASENDNLLGEIAELLATIDNLEQEIDDLEEELEHVTQNE